MAKIMIIEDNENIKKELIEFLVRYGYEAYAPTNFENIVEIAVKDEPDLILLDINLPYYDGYYICREIRKDKDIPIIIVTSRDSEMDEIMSMNLGADDFVTKPYNTQILLARISAVLRRTCGNNACYEIIEHKGLKLNVTNASISFNGKEIELTKNELKILLCLMKNKGCIVSREDLMDYLWNSDLYIDDNTLSVNVTRLRKKLQEIGFKDGIETKRGLGYILL
ncbi:response regulator transcription factor [Clostridium saccharobutylicum]|uniref:Stage 0 sporulation protein A homolog n=1 Tax=Clostridium saccharobutylicum DSM 13864 TaxID=1345695 RepID=U5MW68_CLOSA|nr:response regulator transcription factor [Clostridium saccharobutylicum]AGX44850.1 transcriptional regulatory protein YxdJ [Clostridium saccharobutylicum DSM 13864]AQR92132.1 response regulator protein GraR [Clostridium saccharobutylicum]AQS02034.1 response regulator protein GraR [Clostridium saccharobutylicum]AQS11637.1 response regulator protein GraR [Clostridium saccharobutylicum]AQS16017.1 response regulator protein GraR [Clostridium saccharobutylicum]